MLVDFPSYPLRLDRCLRVAMFGGAVVVVYAYVVITGVLVVVPAADVVIVAVGTAVKAVEVLAGVVI